MLKKMLLTLLLAGVMASPVSVGARQAAAELYTCSMQSDMLDSQPGKCAVCGMTLKTRAMTAPEKELVAFFASYDAAFVAKDLDKLAAMYTPESTVFEGGGTNIGWKDYRDNHIGPEMKSFEGLAFSHSHIVPHLIGKTDAYVTAEYAIKTNASSGGGLATYTLTKASGAWKIRHTHTSAKRAAR
jgi:ketosteroid isomerase-like protein